MPGGRAAWLGTALAAGLAGAAWAAAPHESATAGASAVSAAAPASAVTRAVAESGEADALAAAGAPELALKLIDVSQPDYSAEPASWLVWERKRIAILSGAGDYAALYSRIKAIPADVPEPFRRYALETGAKAALADNDAERARTYLRALIWTDPPPADVALAGYRQLVIRSYVVGNELNDAGRALVYLKRSRDAGNWHTRELAAEVALERGQPTAAVSELAGLKQPEVRPLRLLAELGAGREPPIKLQSLAADLAVEAEKHHDVRLAGRYRIVDAEAAARNHDSEAELYALLAALRLDPGDAGAFGVTNERVWDALSRIGTALGNARQLLLGETDSWLAAAKQESAAHRPMRALALLAAAGLKDPAAEGRAAALDEFADVLSGEPHGDELLLALFQDRQRFPNPVDLPGAVRYQLVDPAVEAGDVEFASSLLAGLNEPPPGVAAGDWQLERARLFLLGGATGSAVELLRSLAAGSPPADGDKLLAVVLDLETLGHDQDALNLLEDMLAARPSPDLARRLLYWIGKAYDDLGVPLDAARAYLESATFNSPYAMDQWAKTARYSAAQALTQAGLYADALNIYQGLLNAASDPTEQALIKERLAAVRTLASRKRDNSGDPRR